jgi:sensor histidine kinase YesM
LIAAAWTALAIFFAVTTSLTYVSQGRAPLWGPVLAQSLAQWWLWALLTPVVIWLSRRWPIARPRIAAALVIHALAGVAIAVGKVMVENHVRQWLFGVRPYLLLNNLALQLSIFWALVAASHVVHRYLASRARASHAESALARAQLQLLRTQLQPHFLFNALSSIAELVHEDPQKADRMLDRLSTLLRATLEAGDRQEITLADELTLLRGYLDIQQTRFGDRLAVSIDVPDD